jgi:hypothetical protein
VKIAAENWVIDFTPEDIDSRQIILGDIEAAV